MLEIFCGILEFFLGNTFPFVVFTSYGESRILPDPQQRAVADKMTQAQSSPPLQQLCTPSTAPQQHTLPLGTLQKASPILSSWPVSVRPPHA